MRWFEQSPAALAELEALLKRDYPTLHALRGSDAITVHGTYPIVNDGVEIDRYSLAIKLPDRYPRELPQVREIGGRIPHSIDRHVFLSGALCLGVREALADYGRQLHRAARARATGQGVLDWQQSS
jgi:hypothetical protein